jgi:hypothetical protein
MQAGMLGCGGARLSVGRWDDDARKPKAAGLCGCGFFSSFFFFDKAVVVVDWSQIRRREDIEERE